MPTPPIPIPPGQQLAWAAATANASGFIRNPLPYGPNGVATSNNTSGVVEMIGSGPLGNPGYGAVWSSFQVSLPAGAAIQSLYPVIVANGAISFVHLVTAYGTTASPLNNASVGLGGINLEGPSSITSFSGQYTTFGPTSVGTSLSGLEIGTQLYQTLSGSGYSDFISVSYVGIAVYYTATFSSPVININVGNTRPPTVGFN